MTCEDIKKVVKEQYGKDITDDEANALLKKAEETASASGELSDEELDGVSGGMGKIVSLVKKIIGAIGNF